MEAKDRICVAIDTSDLEEACTLVRDLAPHVGCFKIGLEFITSSFVRLLTNESPFHAYYLRSLQSLFRNLSGKLFWDGKFDDIPNTITGATAGLAPLEPLYLNVHASAGRKSIAAAVKARGNSMVLGVTVLTSIDEAESWSIFGAYPVTKVLEFARMLFDEGAQGIICSPIELVAIRSLSKFNDMHLVTPGIRPAWAQANDQARIMTPGEAVKAGATRLVIGRPITNPPKEIGSPIDAVKRIAQEIEEALTT